MTQDGSTETEGRLTRPGPWTLQALANAAGTLMAAAVILAVTAVAGVVEDVPVWVWGLSLAVIVVAAVLALLAIRQARAAFDAAEELLAVEQEALAEAADALSGEPPRLSDEQLQAVGSLRLSDEQLSALRKAAAATQGSLALSPEQMAQIRTAVGKTSVITEEQQKALRVLAQNAIPPETRRKLMELNRQLAKLRIFE